VRLYERALTVFSAAPSAPLVREILADEREHLRRFRSFGEEAPFAPEDTALLSAESAQIIFTGGLMEAYRLGAFESDQKLLAYAMDQERAAIGVYTGFAQRLGIQDPRGQAFARIAEEEKKHLASLEAQLKNAIQKE
jgi:rubrerythrin